MAKKNAQQVVKAIVDNFECDGVTDYARMEADVFKATGMQLDNKSLWALINRAQASVERVSFTLDD